MPLSAGTAAVHLWLLPSWGIGATWRRGAGAVIHILRLEPPVTYLGATPVFVDSEPDSWNIDPTSPEGDNDRVARHRPHAKAQQP